MMERIREKKIERLPLNGLLVVKRARIFHKESSIGECQYSPVWQQEFKKRHGVWYLKNCGENISADYEATVNYIDQFAKTLFVQISFEHIYNIDETDFYWCYTPRVIVTTSRGVV